jgi:hypothetical protein
MSLASKVLFASILVSTVAHASLDKNIIHGRIRAHNAEFRACYENALRKDPKLEGEVLVKFVINKEGKVIESIGTGLPPVDACVAKVIERIEFPKNKRGIITINYPFSFKARS